MVAFLDVLILIIIIAGYSASQWTSGATTLVWAGYQFGHFRVSRVCRPGKVQEIWLLIDILIKKLDIFYFCSFNPVSPLQNNSKTADHSAQQTYEDDDEFYNQDEQGYDYAQLDEDENFVDKLDYYENVEDDDDSEGPPSPPPSRSRRGRRMAEKGGRTGLRKDGMDETDLSMKDLKAYHDQLVDYHRLLNQWLAIFFRKIFLRFV